MRIRKIIKPVFDRVFPPLWRWYVRKPRRSRWRDVRVIVPPGVFHPGLFVSSRFLMQYICNQDLTGKRILEIGAGTGIISIAAAKRGAAVVATDISNVAVSAILANAKRNGVQIEVLLSDLYANLNPRYFDYVVVNPPYYPVEPRTEAEFAWYCGAQFEYFQRFFKGLSAFADNNTIVLMVLNEDCKLDEIARIGENLDWTMTEVAKKKRWGEWNYIFRVQKF